MEVVKKFSLVDYGVFVAMLSCCSIIGLYFGFQDLKRKRQKLSGNGSNSDVADYLMGGRQMSVLPVAFSLIASLVSGVLLLGASTEIYLYGTQYVYIIIGIFISAVPLHYVMIPIFHELQITSVYEYLQLRFDKRMRLFGSLMYALSTILWLPIMIYVPALAFNQLSSVNIHIVTPIVMAICVFYTMIGGIKAVVWTDVTQITIMFGTLLTIAIKGTLKIGGVSSVIERNLKSGRIEFPIFNPDPTVRHTFWSLVVGGMILYTAHNGFNQNMMQRYLSLKSVKAARKANFIYTSGLIVIVLLCCFNGLLLYANYFDCDPLSVKRITTRDQLLPLMVMETFRDLPGLTGLFISGIFSAALSSVSTGLNSMSAVVLEDFIKPFTKSEIPSWANTILLRSTVLFLGVVSVGLVYIVEMLGTTILQLTLSLPTACFGPLLGVYIIGFFLPWMNKKATFCGGIIASSLMMLYVFKVQTEMAYGRINFEQKPVSIDGCANKTDFGLPLAQKMPIETSIYQISYLYYTFIGALLVLLFSSIFTWFLGLENAKEIDRKLLAPLVRKYGKPIQNEDVNLSAI